MIPDVSAGGGVELPSHYPQWKVEYIKTDMPSALQSSLNKLVEGTCTLFVCINKYKKQLQKIEKKVGMEYQKAYKQG